MELSRIAFLETYNLEDNGGIMGAILVTDTETKPIEFRVTAPIKTTNFQKTLYGDVLSEHILVELISLPLINAINEEVDLIVVKDPLFLGVNNKQGIRVVRITNSDGKEKSNNSNYVGINTSSMFIETSKKYESELQEIKELMTELSEGRNLLEPFERLKVACEQVHLQKTSE